MANANFGLLFIFFLSLEFQFLSRQLFCLAKERLNDANLATVSELRESNDANLDAGSDLRESDDANLIASSDLWENDDANLLASSDLWENNDANLASDSDLRESNDANLASDSGLRESNDDNLAAGSDLWENNDANLAAGSDLRESNDANLATGSDFLENNDANLAIGSSLNSNLASEDESESNREAIGEKQVDLIQEAIKREIQKIDSGEKEKREIDAREYHEAVQQQRAALNAFARANRKEKRATVSRSQIRANRGDNSLMEKDNVEDKWDLPPYLFDSFQKARGALNGRQRSKRHDHERMRFKRRAAHNEEPQSDKGLEPADDLHLADDLRPAKALQKEYVYSDLSAGSQFP